MISIRYLLKKAIKTALCLPALCPCFQYVCRSARPKRALTILTYHSITDRIHPDETVAPGEFERQLQYLIKNNSKVISLEEAVKHFQSDFEKISGSVVLTFDDGFADNYYNAFPLLKKYNLPATIFLVSDFIDSTKGDYLSTSQILEMKDHNISFASHTISHRILAGLSNEEAVSEIRDSKDILGKKLGRQMDFFAYPIGTRADFNDDTKEIVKSSGYKCACSNIYGMNYENSDMYELKRIGVETTDSFFMFRKKLDGTLNILSIKDTKIFQRLKRAVLGSI